MSFTFHIDQQLLAIATLINKLINYLVLHIVPVPAVIKIIKNVDNSDQFLYISLLIVCNNEAIYISAFLTSTSHYMVYSIDREIASIPSFLIM